METASEAIRILYLKEIIRTYQTIIQNLNRARDFLEIYSKNERQLQIFADLLKSRAEIILPELTLDPLADHLFDGILKSMKDFENICYQTLLSSVKSISAADWIENWQRFLYFETVSLSLFPQPPSGFERFCDLLCALAA